MIRTSERRLPAAKVESLAFLFFAFEASRARRRCFTDSVSIRAGFHFLVCLQQTLNISQEQEGNVFSLLVRGKRKIGIYPTRKRFDFSQA